MATEAELFKTEKTYNHAYSIDVLDDDGETVLFSIENSNLLAESVVLDQRLCSAETLKFGLCEGSTIKFSYFGLANIKNRRIRPSFYYSHYPDGSGIVGFSVGFFTVSSCIYHMNSGIYEVEAYDDLSGGIFEKSAYDYFLADYYSPDKPSFFARDIIAAIERKIGIEPDTEELTQVTTHSTLTRFSSFADEQATAYYFTFNSLKGVENPFNAYRAGVSSTSRELYPRAKIRVVYYNLQANKYYKIVDEKKSVGGMSAWFIDMYDLLQNAINSADVTDDSGETVDPFYRFRNQVDNYENGYFMGWTSLCGVWLYDGENYTRLKSYDTFQGGNTNVDGLVSDYLDCVIHGYTRVYFLTLMSLGFVSTFEGELADEIYTYTSAGGQNNTIDYQYKDSDNVVRTSSYYVPTFDDNSCLSGSEIGDASFYSVWEITNLDAIDKIELNKDNIINSSARKLLADYYETRCVFGVLTATNQISEFSLQQSFLYPHDSLFPADDLYPGGIVEHIGRSVYANLLVDSIVKKFRKLYISWTNGEDNYVQEFVVNVDGNTDYYMDDNVFLMNALDGSYNAMRDIGNFMKVKMKNIIWTPFEMDLVGIPVLEVGEAIEIDDENGNAYITYVLQRCLKGIHSLWDSYYNGELDITT